MGPIRGQARPLPVLAEITPQKIDAKLNASIHNRFDIEVVDAATGKVRQRALAENIICNNFYSCCCAAGYTSSSVAFSYIHYGSGAGTPAASDTSLFTYAGGGSVTGITDTLGSDVYTLQGKITLNETTAVGTTITEVGLAYGSASSSLCTHAMLKDANGNQISIVKTGTDIVNIYATVFVHFSSTALNGFTPTKAFFQWVAGYAFDRLGDYGDAGKFYYYNLGFASHDYVSRTITKSSDNKTITFTAGRLAANVGNEGSGGITKIEINLKLTAADRKYDTALTTNLPAAWCNGYDITGEAIGTGDGTTTAFATDFIHATNATIYVNGVAQSGITVTDASTVKNNIVFATAPAIGAVITGDYHTSVIPKDANHVYDLVITMQLGEHTA